MDMTFGRIICLTSLALSIMAYAGSGACLISFDRMGTGFDDILMNIWIHIGLVPSWIFIGFYIGKHPIPLGLGVVVNTALSLWVLWSQWYEIVGPMLFGFPIIAAVGFYIVWGIIGTVFGVGKFIISGP